MDNNLTPQQQKSKTNRRLRIILPGLLLVIGFIISPVFTLCLLMFIGIIALSYSNNSRHLTQQITKKSEVK